MSNPHRFSQRSWFLFFIFTSFLLLHSNARALDDDDIPSGLNPDALLLLGSTDNGVVAAQTGNGNQAEIHQNPGSAQIPASSSGVGPETFPGLGASILQTSNVFQLNCNGAMFACGPSDGQPAAFSDFNQASIIQNGERNVAGVYQGGPHNLSEIVQNTFLNEAVIFQNGMENGASNSQLGNSNDGNITQAGNENSADLLQTGSGSSGEIIQLGDNHSISVVQGSGMTFSITQQ